MPNLTLGAPIVKSLRQHTSAFLDVHLMVSKPAQWVKDFAAAGADMYTFHLEAAACAAVEGSDEAAALVAAEAAGAAGLPAVHELVAAVHAAGMLCGLTVRPGTPVELLLPYLGGDKGADMVLIMTVEPGFGGQSFMISMMDKVGGYGWVGGWWWLLLLSAAGRRCLARCCAMHTPPADAGNYPTQPIPA